jgi:hypothetical protein
MPPAQTFDASTILSDIRAAGSHAPKRPCRVCDLQRAAENEFCQINGWEIAARSFGLEDIGKRNHAWRDLQQPVFDHCLYFRCNGKNSALVSQPYSPDCRDEAELLAAEHGVELFTPPIARASIWSPRRAFFFVFAALGTSVKWLPEQMLVPR